MKSEKLLFEIFSINLEFIPIISDAGDMVEITGQPSPDEAVFSNTEVQFTCSSNGYPPPTLSLHSSKAHSNFDEENIQDIPKEDFLTSIVLTSAFDNRHFICKAEGSEPTFYTIESETLLYRVKCMLQYYIYIFILLCSYLGDFFLTHIPLN